MRFGEMSSSQCRHTPYEPSLMRPSARRIWRNMFESRSRLRIASSRSPANCTSSRASGAFSITISSRLRSEPEQFLPLRLQYIFKLHPNQSWLISNSLVFHFTTTATEASFASSVLKTMYLPAKFQNILEYRKLKYYSSCTGDWTSPAQTTEALSSKPPTSPSTAPDKQY